MFTNKGGFVGNTRFLIKDNNWISFEDAGGSAIPITSHNRVNPTEHMRVIKSQEPRTIIHYVIKNKITGEERDIRCSEGTLFILAHGRTITNLFQGAEINDTWYILSIFVCADKEYVYNIVSDKESYIYYIGGPDCMAKTETIKDERQAITTTAYELEKKAVAAFEHPIPREHMEEYLSFLYHKKMLPSERFYMLLSKDQRDYTLFDMKGKDEQMFINTFMEVLESRGDCYRIDMNEHHAELWIKYKDIDDFVFCMFFPADRMVV